MTIRVAGLASGYRQVPVIQDINFQIEWGQIVALIQYCRSRGRFDNQRTRDAQQ